MATDTCDILTEVHRLYTDGLYLQAQTLGQQRGPLERWRGTAARVMAGRLANVLGNHRLGSALHLAAHRQDPTNPLAAYYATRTRLTWRGPLAAWDMLARIEDFSSGPAGLSADWHTLRAYVLALLRDFGPAEEQLKQAVTLAPRRPWTHVESAYVHELRDRLDQALECALHALDLRPWFRPAVQSAAQLYQHLGRDREALNLLVAASEHIECGDVLMQLSDLQLELGHDHDARQSLERAAELLPLADKGTLHRLNARRSDIAYCLGDEPAAIEAAERVGQGFYQHVADNLRAAGADHRRVQLPVGFVRQDHLTCGPATLAALAKFWQQPVDQVQIVEQICYDGTPSQRERQWAEQHGFVAREFAVDWDSTVALIDRGIPFTLTTVAPTSAHLQAVIGYDARRRTLLLRDPSLHQVTELLAEDGLRFYRDFGPRGMLMVPREQASLLDGLALPEAELFDRFYELLQALDRYDRDDAQAAYDRMQILAAGQRLTLHARRCLAGYDADEATLLRVLEQSLALIPDSGPLLFAKLGALRSVASRQERLTFLAQVCAQQDREPIFQLHWAEELIDDARTHDDARRLLKRLFRRQSHEPRCYHALANIEWAARRFERATWLYRVAACLDERREYGAKTYLGASRQIKRVDDALTWLNDRVRRFGNRSSDPAQTLFWAYDTLDRTAEAFAVLDDALARRKEDAGLQLFAVEVYGRHGRFEAAEQALADCHERAHPGQWLRAAAVLAGYRGDPQRSLEAWQQVLTREPQSVEATASIARLLAQVVGQQAALDHLRQLIERFPHNVALLRLAIEWWRNDDALVAENMVDRLLALNPIEPWTRRERAVTLLRQQRHEEALAAADLAISLQPNDSYGHSIRAAILVRALRPDEAVLSFQRALELNVDNDSGIQGWLEICQSHAERASALDFFYAQLVAQTTFGDGLLLYHQLARNVFEPEKVLEHLRAGLSARPDLWHAWAAVVRQLVGMQRATEAIELAREAATRFPLIPAAWVDVAAACQASNDNAGEIAALQKAIEINANWTTPIYRLVDVYERLNQLTEAKTVIEQALTRLPTDAVLHGYQADVHWRLEEREAALAAARRAVELDPGYNWGWESLRTYAAELHQPETAVAVARQLTEHRPKEARSWYWLAQMLVGPETLDERLAALDRAHALSPSWIEVQVFRSKLLVEASRYFEASEACRGAHWQGRVPIELRVQEASVLHARGKIAEAVEHLRAVLADNPDYVPGWWQLAGWCEQDVSQRPVYLEAARNLTRVAPGDASAWRHLADAHLAAGDPDEARPCFKRALALAPQYRYAAIRLSDLEMDARRWRVADELLEGLESAGPDAYVTARRVRWAADQDLSSKALAALRALCRTPCDGDWPLSFALGRISERYWSGPAETVLAKAATEPEASPFVVEEWVGLLAQRKEWRAAIGALRRARDDAAWVRAANRLFRGFAKGGSRRWLQRLITTHRERLRNNAELWGMAGYAMANCRQQRRAVEWMADWRTREGVCSWMLTNLTSSLHDLGRHAEAADVHEYALTLAADHSTADHQTWLAVSEIVAGHPERAGDLLAASESAQFVPFFQCARAAARFALQEIADMRAQRRWFRLWRVMRGFRRAIRPQKTWLSGSRPLKWACFGCLSRVLTEARHPVLAATVRYWYLVG